MKFSFLPALALFAAALPAAAQMPRDRNGLALFEKADANHDGSITREEYAAARMEQFATLDHNGDGVISKSDFSRLSRVKPQAEQRLDQIIAETDINHDGQVSRAEFAAAPMPMFDRLDTNADGVIDRTELARAQEKIQSMKGRRN